MLKFECNQHPNIWGCLEFYCISRDFEYEQYSEVCTTRYGKAAVMHHNYELLRSIFHNEMSEFYSVHSVTDNTQVS